MNERELKIVGIAAGAGLLGIVIVNQVYQSGFNAGLAQSGNPTAVAYHRDGFIPFPLLLIAGVVLFVIWRKRTMGGNGPGSFGRGPGSGGPPRMFEEWHRRAHEGGANVGPNVGAAAERGPVAAAPDASPSAQQTQPAQPERPAQPQSNPNETKFI